MVSKASDDLPEPESPVKTTSLSRGIDSVTFLRLCSRAPRIVIWSVVIFMSFLGDPRLFLFSRHRKRSAGCGDQPAVRPFDPALRDAGPAPCMDDLPGRSERLADLRRRDEAELQVEAHRAHHTWLDRVQRPAHRRVGQRTDHATVDETGAICHVFRGRHLDCGAALSKHQLAESQPGPGRGCEPPYPAPRAILPGERGGKLATHGPRPPEPACMSRMPWRQDVPARRKRRLR